MAAPGCGPSG